MARNVSPKLSARSVSKAALAARRAVDDTDPDDLTATNVAKTAAKQAAVGTVAKAAAKKGVPLAGVEEVIAKPKSVKAWSIAGARTAVAAGLTAVTGGAGVFIESFISKVGYKRLAIGAAATVIASLFMTFILLITVVAAVTETVTKPVSIIGSIMDSIPGFGPDDEQMEGIPDRMCPMPPDPRAPQASLVTSTTAPTPTTSITPGDPDEPSAEPITEQSSGFVPEPAIDKDGKITDKARALMSNPNIDKTTDPLRVETWMLYVMSHPDDDPKSQWDTFTGEYRAAYAYVAKERGLPETPTTTAVNSNKVNTDGSEPVGLRPIRTDITPIELVMSIDPNTFYDPFQLAAATMVSSMVLEKDFLNQTDDQVTAVVGRMQALCGM